MRYSQLMATQLKRIACRAVILSSWVLFVFAPPASEAAAANVDRAAGKVDFARDILPILSDNCFKCHGPDEKSRKGKLRLDTKDGAFRVKDGKTVIVPGKSAASELFRRITSSDSEDLMPPPESNRKLTAGQITLLRRWIDEGAQWERHWAFKPVQASKPPP